jgi:hypothetical protein
VEVSYGAYALVERNVFDHNRHAIAGDGRAGTGYLAHDNLILPNGGVHFRCVITDGLGLIELVFNPFKLPVELTKAILGEGDIYYTHALDMHGSTDQCGFLEGDHNCGLAGEYMEIEYNTIMYTRGNSIHLRGTPSDKMLVTHNVFANGRKNGGAVSAGALVQNEKGLVDSANTYGSTAFFHPLTTCDFDGDGVIDPFAASGVTWWYSSSRKAGHWVFLNRSTKLTNNIELADKGGDGRCDATVGGVVFHTPKLDQTGTTTGDLNGDGKADITWHNATTGETRIWYMNDGRISGETTVVGQNGQPMLVGLPYSIVG